jgi:hypothetical protein
MPQQDKIAQTTPQLFFDWGKIDSEEAQKILSGVRGLSGQVREQLQAIATSGRS